MIFEKLPENYQWLEKEPAPRILVEALKLYGTKETLGSGNNPVIIEWAKELGLQHQYNADSIPWCGLFMAIVAKRAGKPIPSNPLWARNWAIWGSESHTPKLGDVLVFSRDNSGHVGVYVGEDDYCFHVLGGNQSDSVSFSRLDKSRLIAARTFYKLSPPTNCRPIYLSTAGKISTNEA